MRTKTTNPANPEEKHDFVFTDAEREEMIRYYLALEKYQEKISEVALEELKDHPVFGKLLKEMPVEAREANAKLSRELQKDALFNDNWQPYIQYQIQQGTLYATMGLSFHSWYDVLVLAKKYVTPCLIEEYGYGPELVGALNGMYRMIDIGMSLIGEAYLRQKEEITIRDREEIRRLNEELEEKVSLRTAELEKSKVELSMALRKEKQLNELKSRFLAMASHEFRTPLTSIMSSTEIMSGYGPEDNEKREKHLKRIKSSVNSMNSILEDFLSLSKIEDGKLEAVPVPFDLENMLEELCREMEGIAKSGQNILCSYKGQSMVKTDPKILRNIFINLVSNAIKFSGEGLTIEVSAATGNKEARIEVRDRGMGISEKDKEHIFERFFRSNDVLNIPGTGLGLNIVSKYLELLNGKIDFDSELGKGTVFIVTFPLTR